VLESVQNSKENPHTSREGQSLFVAMGLLTLLINKSLEFHSLSSTSELASMQWVPFDSPFKEPPFSAFTTEQNQLAQASMLSGL
jgi:hypothetical protein